MKKLLFIFSFVTAIAVYAQEPDLNFIEGEVLVAIDSPLADYGVEDLMNDTSRIQFNYSKQLSKTLNIWQLKFDISNGIDETYVINQLMKNPLVKYAQKNHIVKSRSTVPDDPLFAQQWQYLQDSDGDIDADLAWDITTGGTTVDGHTIVSAVADGGYQLNHPDMVDRFWVNEAEIEDNGIDDDENGFIDDVNGWNANNNTDNLPVDSHGTAVAGIIGANGNNGIGVTGVNWDAKIMATLSSGNEAIVVESYDYALQNRLKFNETNGEEGAFVVVTNSSFGIDFGDPADFPLWCDMFDTLGQAGILSCGATINGNQNVDVVGDVPTACPSDYLISVTNTNRQDRKVVSAGFGAETIDLGAPGQGTFTITSGSSYSAFGGTSGATPHVAGTVALLYSAPYEAFMEMALAEPAETALLIKEYILNGVDPNETLEGITVTGGRLNANNSLQLLRSDFDPLSVDEARVQGVSIYPNPTTNVLNISIKDGSTWETATIYGVDGRRLKEVKNTGNSQISTAFLTPGTYILKVASNSSESGKTLSRLFIKN
ncbi:T9SS C-terminal target domain-containing protein [Dokdonia sinensis]|uniref:T9SS C-terminal target domain-containing protein n=1 Tax=Dokdonia sinensis TaxID=2479847 RepID=A0A3M0FZD0_9FLAO|nr:S8 family peptidase [Dokdonia sinensis]RMB58030.1 T9SS C-terminal target domain-containing protein [Dokdonia sinensis]